MITSYMTSDESTLYLALVGVLHEYSADDLVNEYYERHSDKLEQCILDLSGVERAEIAGLQVLNRLSLLCQVDGAALSAVAGGSPEASRIRQEATRHRVPIVDGSAAPFEQRAG